MTNDTHPQAQAPVTSIRVPSMKADAATVNVTEFTVHVTLGSSSLDGNVVPVGHVAISKGFARALCRQIEQLLEASEEELEVGERRGVA